MMRSITLVVFVISFLGNHPFGGFGHIMSSWQSIFLSCFNLVESSFYIDTTVNGESILNNVVKYSIQL